MLKLRRLAHLLLALALITGVVTQAARATHMCAKMSMASTMPMSDKCHGCGGDGDGCKFFGSCSACCGALIALPVTATDIYLLPAHLGDYRPGTIGVGWAAPPDPYPPRPAILS